MKYILSSLITIFLISCSINYSFTGSSLTEEETITVNYIENKSPYVVPTLSQTLTQALTDKFQQQSPLELVSRDGDIEISGEITNYKTIPVAIQKDAAAAQTTRLEITVNISCTNRISDEKSYEQSFSSYEEFNSETQTLEQRENELIQSIVEKLVEDIVNKTIADW